MNSTKKVVLAETIAKNAHFRLSPDSVINHCARVANIVSLVTLDEDVISAAWLHDVLENVSPHKPFYNVDFIEENCGSRVAQLVLEVSENNISQVSKQAKIIKLADLIDNVKHNNNCHGDKGKLLHDLSDANDILYAHAKDILSSKDN